ncbi:MAG: homoserine O-acetyltransferase/O-succinyltransferase family protein [Acidimicrobiales bacterium]
MSVATPAKTLAQRAGRPRLVIALVNNMPDGAFVSTERQFLALLESTARVAVDVVRYSMPDPNRSAPVRSAISERYEDMEELYRRSFDGVIVTGNEPRCTDLRDEVVWDGLSAVCEWAQATSSSLLLSCLAAHGGLLAMDGLARRRLPTKLSGVYKQESDPRHPLTAGLSKVLCPHSRLHEVPAEVLGASGYEVIMGSPEVGWTVAVRDEPCLKVLLQGHPEYSPTTLLAEYRRDVRRFLEGSAMTYPEVPVGYLRSEAMEMLESFRHTAMACKDPNLLGRFPFETCSNQIVADWRPVMVRLFENWLTELSARQLLASAAQAG